VHDITLTQQANLQKCSRAVSDAGMAALKASQAADIKALVAANNQLVDTCESCHKEFKPDLPSEGIAHMHMHEVR
jgi:cytochrome c556